MSIEPIGLLIFSIAMVCLFLDYGALLITLVTCAVMGAAAAVLLGSANIPPAHAILGLAVLNTLGRSRQCAAILRALHPGQPGFWVLCLVGYCLISAFFFPRVFAGTTQIYPIGSSAFESTGSTVPLGPVSGNFTQGFYIIGSLIVFLMVTSVADEPAGFRIAVTAALSYCIANTVFAFLDLVTYSTGTQDVLDLIRNARYAMHTETEVNGVKRVVGSFTEASAFGRASMGVFGFVTTLWLCGYRPWLTGTVALLTFVFALMSTSSAALVVLPFMIALLYVSAVLRSLGDAPSRVARRIVVMTPLAVLALVMIVLSIPSLSAGILHYLDMAVFSKAGSDSGVERGAWNLSALQNFIDTRGLGVGLGTIRTSSFAAALLGGVGLLGTSFYLVFIALAFGRNPGRPGLFITDARRAARNGAIGLGVTDLMLGPSVDQGLLFYTLAAIASARPDLRGAAATARGFAAPYLTAVKA